MTERRRSRAINGRLLMALAGLVVESCASAPSIPPTEKLIVRGDRLFVPATINGVAVEALLDSAAELTLLDDDFAARLGLAAANPGGETAKGTGGEQSVAFAENVDLAAAGVTLDDRTVAVLDLADISARLVGAPVDVVLGREFFDAGRIVIDIEGGRIRPISRDKAPEGVKLALAERHGLKTVSIAIEGASAQADFDLGNGSDMLLGAAFATAHGLDAPNRITGTKEGGGIGGSLGRKMISLKTVELAGAQFYDVPAAIDATPTAADANVGVKLLRHFVLTVDFPENAVWLDRR